MNKYQEIKDRTDKATPGPWTMQRNNAGEICGVMNVKTKQEVIWTGYLGTTDEARIDEEDAEFIANARTDIPLLLKALELACNNSRFGSVVKADYYLEVARIDLEVRTAAEHNQVKQE